MLKAHKEEEMIAMAAAVVNSIAAMNAVHKDELLYQARHEMSAASGPRDENTSHAEYRIVAFARSYLLNRFKNLKSLSVYGSDTCFPPSRRIGGDAKPLIALVSSLKTIDFRARDQCGPSLSIRKLVWLMKLPHLRTAALYGELKDGAIHDIINPDF